MLGLACGRIGCFSFGCCWGKPTEAWWGVVFPPGAPAYAHPDLHWPMALIPTQLLSSASALLLFVALSLYFHYGRKREGEVAALLLVLYPVARFCIEFLRHETAVPGRLSVSQWISVPTFLAGVAMLVWVRRRPAPAAATRVDAAPPQKRQSSGHRTSKSRKRRERKETR